ncbi:prophage antirepressor-like protein [Metapseudomonas resinovorans]|uniref:BRO-N domain-containing protein n=1 Tax=Metapseudomonas resinovorans TaxID=53412 RepID=UPI003D2405E3
MHDAYTPIVFHHHTQRLRAVMIDNQPWFVAHDFAQLMGVRNSRRLLDALERFERRTVLLASASGFHEEVEAISDAGAYKVLFRFGRPGYVEISRWLSEVLVPTLHDYHRDLSAEPRRAFLTWDDRKIGVVKWQREVWVAWRDLPVLMKDSQEVLP